MAESPVVGGPLSGRPWAQPLTGRLKLSPQPFEWRRPPEHDLAGIPHGPSYLFRWDSVPNYKLPTSCDKYGRQDVQLFDKVVPIYS